jgi:uncharacterized membrane protein
MRRALPLVLVLAAIAAGCNLVTIDEYPCPKGGTTLTYDNFGKGFFIAYCNTCHSAPDGQRNGAPDDEVFDSVEEIRAHAATIFIDAATTNDAMPPGPYPPPIAARDQLAEWLACGAP